MNQSKFGSYYDSTRNARPYTNSYGGNQHVNKNDHDNRNNNDYNEQEEEDDYENTDHVYASDAYDDENLEGEDSYYGRYTGGRETGSYNNYRRSNEQRNNFGYGNYSGRGDYGYQDQQTLPQYNRKIFSGYGGSNYKGISYGRHYTGYSNDEQNNDYSLNCTNRRNSLNQSNVHGNRRRRRSDYSY
jgi:hypothetical protein